MIFKRKDVHIIIIFLARYYYYTIRFEIIDMVPQQYHCANDLIIIDVFHFTYDTPQRELKNIHILHTHYE